MCDNVEYLFVPESKMPDRVLVGSINMSRNHGMVAYVPERTTRRIWNKHNDCFECENCGKGMKPAWTCCPSCGAKVVR